MASETGYCYDAMIGVGGIGSGRFFALSGDHTLGREESREGRFLDRRDYCKLHIISHYVRALAGAEFAVIPVGKVGEDEVGRGLLAEMAAAGLDVRYVERVPEADTLFSFCFVYPDGSGGNMTTADSASARVDATFLSLAAGEFERYGGRGIVLAAPEAPLETRAALLELGTRHEFLRVASFTTGEIPAALAGGLLERVDVLALNRDEAAALAGAHGGPGAEVASRAAARLREVNPAARLSCTAGREGSWTFEGGEIRHLPALAVPVASTAGAGDAHLAAIIAGLAAGMPLAAAQELGSLTASASVTSPHTIHPEIAPAWLLEFARRHGVRLGAEVEGFLASRSANVWPKKRL